MNRRVLKIVMKMYEIAKNKNDMPSMRLPEGYLHLTPQGEICVEKYFSGMSPYGDTIQHSKIDDDIVRFNIEFEYIALLPIISTTANAVSQYTSASKLFSEHREAVLSFLKETMICGYGMYENCEEVLNDVSVRKMPPELQQEILYFKNRRSSPEDIVDILPEADKVKAFRMIGTSGMQIITSESALAMNFENNTIAEFKYAKYLRKTTQFLSAILSKNTDESHDNDSILVDMLKWFI